MSYDLAELWSEVRFLRVSILASCQYNHGKSRLALVIQRRMYLHQMDVANAFLHGNLSSDVFMQQPPGFEKNLELICRLKKAIYGLQISPSLEQNDLFMVGSLCFQRAELDPCLYTKLVGDIVVVVYLIYIDDELIMSRSSS